VKVNGTAARRFRWRTNEYGTPALDSETKALVQRWIIRFCEAPVLIDPELMRRVLDEVEPRPVDRTQ
jgi:hypothetical protein